MMASGVPWTKMQIFGIISDALFRTPVRMQSLTMYKNPLINFIFIVAPCIFRITLIITPTNALT